MLLTFLPLCMVGVVLVLEVASVSEAEVPLASLRPLRLQHNKTMMY